MMKFVLGCLFVVMVAADNYCNYDLVGDEILVEAVPIGDYQTSGNDAPRKSWCIAGCDTKVSIKGMFTLLEAGPKTPTYTQLRHIDLKKRNVYREVRNKETGELFEVRDDDMFCIDSTVSAQIDAVFDKYPTVSEIVKGLNSTINKPGWAYLVIQYIDDSVGEGANLKQNTNFCYKSAFKQIGDDSYFFDVLAMAVDDSKN